MVTDFRVLENSLTRQGFLQILETPIVRGVEARELWGRQPERADSWLIRPRSARSKGHVCSTTARSAQAHAASFLGKGKPRSGIDRQCCGAPNSPATRDGTTPGPLVVLNGGGTIVSKSVLDAIREGDWNFEPERVEEDQFAATEAIPGTRAKLAVLAARARAGLPLWHDEDRLDYDDGNA